MSDETGTMVYAIRRKDSSIGTDIRTTGEKPAYFQRTGFPFARRDSFNSFASAWSRTLRYGFGIGAPVRGFAPAIECQRPKPSRNPPLLNVVRASELRSILRSGPSKVQGKPGEIGDFSAAAAAGGARLSTAERLPPRYVPRRPRREFGSDPIRLRDRREPLTEPATVRQVRSVSVGPAASDQLAEPGRRTARPLRGLFDSDDRRVREDHFHAP